MGGPNEVFQSAPDRSPERPPTSGRQRTWMQSFNPLSGPEPGETQYAGAGELWAGVSIRSPDRSPERPRRGRYRPQRSGFNPLSGPEPGETQKAKEEAARHNVSIRSPDRSPERLGPWTRVARCAVSIRSPDRSPERLGLSWPPAGHLCFNPLPTGARRDPVPSPRLWARGFNPLSGPEPGETRAKTRRGARNFVSIRSPDRSPERPQPCRW